MSFVYVNADLSVSLIFINYYSTSAHGSNSELSLEKGTRKGGCFKADLIKILTSMATYGIHLHTKRVLLWRRR